MSLGVIKSSELGRELEVKLKDIFEEYDLRQAYIFNNYGETCIIAKFRYEVDISSLEKDIENILGYPMRVYDMSVFDIGMMDWDTHGVSKDVEDRIDTLYEITKTMELIYRERITRTMTRKRKRSVEW